jgi:hypothetical protein
VAISFDLAVLGAHSHPLPRGPRVRLRLAQIRDARAIQAFLAGHGFEDDGLDAQRLVHADPRQRIAICATALIAGTETILGFGAIDVGATEPDLLFVDRELTDGLDALMRDALLRRSEAISSRAA